MTVLLVVGAVAASLLHALFFLLESVWWMSPKVHRDFGLDEAGARTCRPFAFNQGFYNLCLACGLATGLALFLNGARAGGAALIAFCAGTMVVAAAVLLATDRKFLRGALIQGLPPLAALAALWMLRG